MIAIRLSLAAMTASAALLASVAAAPAADVISAVTYACDGGKTIAATYYADRVDLVLGDGRKLELPQTMSGSGIRYANGDESFVFWSKGNTAFITEGKDETFANCLQK